MRLTVSFKSLTRPLKHFKITNSIFTLCYENYLFLERGESVSVNKFQFEKDHNHGYFNVCVLEKDKELREVVKMEWLKIQSKTKIHFQPVHTKGLFFWLAYAVIIYHSSANCKQGIHKLVRLAGENQQYRNQGSIYCFKKNLPEKILILGKGEVNLINIWEREQYSKTPVSMKSWNVIAKAFF